MPSSRPCARCGSTRCNVVGNIYIRKVEKKNGRLVNTNIYTYPNVSQFWTYDPKEFLKQPVYSRDWPPMKST